MVGPIAAPGHVPSVGLSGEPDLGGVAGASAELTHILIDVPAEGKQTWPGDATVDGGPSLYEYDGTGNEEPLLVGVKNKAPLTEEAAREGKAHVNEAAELVSRCGARLGDKPAATAANAVSASGEMVYFTALECADGPVANELYARIAGSHTVDVSEPAMTPAREAECSGACREEEISEGGANRKAAVYQGASEDGAKVFFTTDQGLLNVDKDTGSDLYEAELEGGAHPSVKRLVMISQGEADAGDLSPGEGAGATGIAAISESGARVYFESSAVLTAEANANGERAEAGHANLYVYDTEPDHEQPRPLAFVAQAAAVIDTTHDGGFLLFESGDSDLKGAEDSSTVAQLFEYDADTGTVARVSVGQKSPGGYECETTHVVEEGYNCNGNTASQEDAPTPATKSTYEFNVSLPAAASSGRALAEDGTVVFMSRDALTPLATAGGENIYEYRGGNVYLISPGDEAVALKPPSGEGTRLLGISESGQNVFFSSTEQLVPQDTDTQSSWYDAREAGGFPAPASGPACAAGTCQGPLSVAPALPGPGGSALTTGGENLSPAALATTTKVSAKSKTVAETRAEKLAKALKACRAEAKARRKSCEAGARRRYGAKVKAKKSSRGGR